MSTKHLKESPSTKGDLVNGNNEITLESLHIDPLTLSNVVSNILCTEVVNLDYHIEQLYGGTIGDIYLISGLGTTIANSKEPYNVVFKKHKKWERYADKESWRREYDLYQSNLSSFTSQRFCMPECYHSHLNDDSSHIWIAYIQGQSGNKLTVTNCEEVAKELGRFQGKLYCNKDTIVESITNLSDVNYVKAEYLRYRSWPEVYEYIRSDECPLPKHIRHMIIDLDNHWDLIWSQIVKLPVVLCHRDFWITNIIYANDSYNIIDWDTAGWGFLGEDIASLICDEQDINSIIEIYDKCVPAYYEGFSEFVDIRHINSSCIYELMLIMFGYRLVEWFKFSESEEEKDLHQMTLTKIYEIGQK